jgi:hypothetical protein
MNLLQPSVLYNQGVHSKIGRLLPIRIVLLIVSEGYELCRLGLIARYTRYFAAFVSVEQRMLRQDQAHRCPALQLRVKRPCPETSCTSKLIARGNEAPEAASGDQAARGTWEWQSYCHGNRRARACGVSTLSHFHYQKKSIGQISFESLRCPEEVLSLEPAGFCI